GQFLLVHTQCVVTDEGLVTTAGRNHRRPAWARLCPTPALPPSTTYFADSPYDIGERTNGPCPCRSQCQPVRFRSRRSGLTGIRVRTTSELSSGWATIQRDPRFKGGGRDVGEIGGTRHEPIAHRNFTALRSDDHRIR